MEFTPLIPLFPLPQNKKQNLILFKSDLHSQIKEKHIHQLTTRYPVTALSRASTQIFFRSAPENFGYRYTLDKILFLTIKYF